MATMYVAPLGAGLMNGSNWANAAAFTNLNAMIEKAGAGGSVLMRADQGAYTAKAMNITFGGAVGAPVTIKGVDSSGRDMAIDINGSRALDSSAATIRGGEVFVLSAGASNLKFENIDFHNVLNAYRVKSALSNIEIGNSDSTNVQRFFENRADSDANPPATISSLSIHDVKVTGYSKNVIRLQYDTHDVVVSNVVGDVAGKTFDNFAMGVHLDGTAHDVVFTKVTMLNNQNFLGTYWNGDGFATEGGTHHISFIDTVARGSTDGGYDIKSDYTTFLRAEASDNGRNYRIWGNNNTMTDSVGFDPHGRKEGFTNAQVWMSGDADIAIKNSAFIDSGWDTKVFNFDDHATITLDGVTVQYASSAALQEDVGTLSGLTSSSVTTVAATGEWSSGSRWSGAGSAQGPGQTVNGTSGADTLTGSTGNDVISGADGNDRISALGGNDALRGGNGDDTLIGGGGADALDGGTGIDTASLSGARHDYSFRFADGKLVVDDLRTVDYDGIDTMIGIEKVLFAGGDNAPVSAIKGSFGSEALRGTSAKDIFFYDTAVGLSVGSDTFKDFGAGDRLVTTAPLRATIANSSDLFEFGGASGSVGSIGSVRIWGTDGKLRTRLEIDHVEDVGGIRYHVYKTSGDAVAGSNLGLNAGYVSLGAAASVLSPGAAIDVGDSSHRIGTLMVQDPGPSLRSDIIDHAVIAAESEEHFAGQDDESATILTELGGLEGILLADGDLFHGGASGVVAPVSDTAWIDDAAPTAFHHGDEISGSAAGCDLFQYLSHLTPAPELPF